MIERSTDSVATIKRMYFTTTAATIQRDLRRAVELFKAMTEAERERVAVYMDGLSQMRSEWALEAKRAGSRARTPGRGSKKR